MGSAGAGHGISLLVPFRANPGDPGYIERIRNFEWIKGYWHAQLPLAEFVHGHDESHPYSKTRAVNDAAKRAHGDVVVILDADAYFPAEVLETAAREIRLARQRDYELWYVPYRRFYRLDREISELVCWSDPWNPLVLPDPPPKRYAEELPTYSNSDVRAHWYGALVQVMPREAFDAVGGMDERFAGWGAEDVAFMRAVDTLYAPHKTLPRAVCHLYHPRVGATVKDRKWAGQEKANSNWPLSSRYLNAKGDPARMRELVDEWKANESATGICTPTHVNAPSGSREEVVRDNGASGPDRRLPHKPAGLPSEPVHSPGKGGEYAPEPFYASSATVPHFSSGGFVPQSFRDGTTSGKRVGRVKAFARDVKDIVEWLWAWYIAPLMERLGWNHRTENSPGDDAN